MRVLHEVTRKDMYYTPKRPLDCPDLVELLIQHGAYVDQEDDTGQTPLHQAVINRLSGSITVFLDYGANPRTVCNMGRTLVILGNSQ